jgi:membrane-associated phospholipid phosphatase
MTASRRYKNGRLTATDRITILYIVFTTLLLLAGIGRLEHSGPHFLMRAMMVAFIGIIIFLEQEYEGRWTRILHAMYPLLFLAYFFPETDYLNDLFMDVLDPAIIRLEMALFGSMPSMTFSACCPQPWFSEMMHAGYFSFYLIILFFAVYYFVKRPELFPRRMFGFFFAFYVFYLIFALFPSAGPQYFFAPPANEVPQGYLITDLMNRILLFGDRPTGAFPSSHIGMTWLIMYFFFRDRRRLFYYWLLPALILTLATVYIKAHYAVDVLGGFLMVPLLVWTGERAWQLLRREEIVSGDAGVADSPAVPPVI